MHTKKNLDAAISKSIILAASELMRAVPYGPRTFEAAAFASVVAATFLSHEVNGHHLHGENGAQSELELRDAVETATEAARAALEGVDEEAAPGAALAVEKFEALLELALLGLLSPALRHETESRRTAEVLQ